MHVQLQVHQSEWLNGLLVIRNVEVDEETVYWQVLDELIMCCVQNVTSLLTDVHC